MNTKWHYNSHEVVVRIPSLVGSVWEMGYITHNRCTMLGKFECVPATSQFNGGHMGHGMGAEVLLAKDEADSYLLIKPRRYVFEEDKA